MPGLNATVRNSELDHFGTLVTFVSLHTADPGNGATAAAGEVAAGAYVRKAVTWAAASAGSKTSAAAITFDVPAATTITHLGYFSASTAGTFYGSRALSASETYATAGTYTIAAGSLTESLAG